MSKKLPLLRFRGRTMVAANEVLARGLAGESCLEVDRGDGGAEMGRREGGIA